MFREDRLRRREPWGLATVSSPWTADPSWAWRQGPPATNLPKISIRVPQPPKCHQKSRILKPPYTKLGNSFFALNITVSYCGKPGFDSHINVNSSSKMSTNMNLNFLSKALLSAKQVLKFFRSIIYIHICKRIAQVTPNMLTFCKFTSMWEKKSEKARFSTYDQ